MHEKVFTAVFWIDFWNGIADNALHALLQISGIIVAYLLLRTLANRLIDGILATLLAREARLGTTEERTGRMHTLQGLCRNMIGYVLAFVFGVLLFQAIGFNIMPFIASASVIGLAVGFGAQKLVKDVISGFFIVIDNIYVVGETIGIGGVTGQVQEMGMRVTRLLDTQGKLHLFANGDIGTVTNLSRHPVHEFIEVGVAAEADLAGAFAVIDQAGIKMLDKENHAFVLAPVVEGVSAFTALAVTIRIAVVTEPRSLLSAQMRVREDVRTALLAAKIPLA